ncbi:hypothetical protein [Cryobacterium sp. BB307]|uniref:hypothetical protein n=1 Tax=Cryobacterium sp. BB307 TaxID=2716317 RepID=UPI0014461C87|nr:hypothetical protein [Cryobacterium sp. BB307]
MSQQSAPLTAAILAGGIWAIGSIGVAALAGRLQAAVHDQVGLALVVLGGIGATSYIPVGLVSSAVGHATPQLIPYGDQITPYFALGGLVAVATGAVILLVSRLVATTDTEQGARERRSG